MTDSTIDKVRRALGRSEPLVQAPTPPEIDLAIARLVAKDADVVDRFIRSAREAKCAVETIPADRLCGRLIEFMRVHNCRRIGIGGSDLLDRLEVHHSLRVAGLTALKWDELTLDAAYDLDCGISDVHAAVAETGSLVILPEPRNGRALSLVPPIHVAVVEPQQIVPDLIDLFEKTSREAQPPNVTLITGPSKTADIEGSLVTGVHGPGMVQIFLLQ